MVLRNPIDWNAARLLVVIPLLCFLSRARGEQAQTLVLRDRFDRDVTHHGVALVDWEGFIANPAVRLKLQGFEGAAYPIAVTLSCSECRINFNMPSTVGADGPTKVITLENAGTPSPFQMAIFPDRDGADEQHALLVESVDAIGRKQSLTVPVEVIDHDKRIPLTFSMPVNFANDQSGFFKDLEKRKVAQQAADDWAYFIDGNRFDPVPAGSEEAIAWVRDWKLPPPHGPMVRNAVAYRGFWIEAVGLAVSEVRAGGAGTFSDRVQLSNGVPLPLARSGNASFDPRGNWHKNGWLVSLNDDDWWKHTGLADSPADLLSVAHHEFGHAFAFNAAHLGFKLHKEAGRLRSRSLDAYHGEQILINETNDHIDRVVDRMSLKGGFGAEWNRTMPARRWIATKLDLLALQAIGYPLRITSCFVPLRLAKGPLPRARCDKDYDQRISASGGVPAYRYTLVAGQLPPGLRLDSFSGRLTGTPSAAGRFLFEVQVQDQDEKESGMRTKFAIRVE